MTRVERDRELLIPVAGDSSTSGDDVDVVSSKSSSSSAAFSSHEESVGIPILEVFEVKYLGPSPVKPENQVGTIWMVANNTLYHLYNQSQVDMNKPSIQYRDQIRVNDVGPICNFTDLNMEFRLFRGAYKGSISIDDEHDEVGFTDCLVKSETPSVDGCRHISVLFGSFRRATVANLEVVLSGIPVDVTANVYGVVAATNTKFDYPSCTSTLFFKEEANTIKVGHNGVIPLSKPRVGLPLDSQLIVHICLFCDGDPYKGTACFTPGTENQCSDDILDGRIEVKVTWNWEEDSVSTDDEFNYCTSNSESDNQSEDREGGETLETIP